MIKAVLLDLDGTLIPFYKNSEFIWREACINFLKHFSINISVELIINSILKKSSWFWADEVRHQNGRINIHETRKVIVNSALKEIGLEKDGYSEYIVSEYTTIYMNNIQLFEGVAEFLEKIRYNGIKLFLVTNGGSLFQRKKLKKLNADIYFDEIFIEEELGFGKPDKRVYNLIMNKHSFTPDEIVMAGDNLQWDVAAPLELGINSFYITDSCENITNYITVKNVCEIEKYIFAKKS